MSMGEAPTIPVLESRLRKLEHEHTHLGQIKTKAEECAELKKLWIEKKDELKTAKGNLDTALAELLNLSTGEPPKPDDQKKFPFVTEETEPEASAAPAEAEPAQSEPEILIPADIMALDVSLTVKKQLVKAGCKCIADVIDVGNKNWPDLPKGFASCGIGPKAVTKLASILPSTTAPVPESVPSSSKRIKILTFSAQCSHLTPGDVYDATVLEDGNAIVQLPGMEPVQFFSHEYELEETQA